MCNPHWASVATAEYAVQTARYPARKMPTGTSGRAAVCRRRLTPRKASTIGAAEGTIMATIITAHITKSNRTVVAPHSWAPAISMPDISIPDMSMPGIDARV